MSVEALMTQEVTLQKFAGVAVLAGATHGESRPTYTSLRTKMYLESSGPAGRSPGHEARADRNTPISDWFATGRIEIDFTSWDRIVYDDGRVVHTLEIVSPPQKMYNPRTRTFSHWELYLREIK